MELVKKHINGAIDGIVYYFCCEKCKGNFMAEPRKYINCCEKINLKTYRKTKNERKIQRPLKIKKYNYKT